MPPRKRRSAQPRFGKSDVSGLPSNDKNSTVSMSSFIRRQPLWIVLAVASGACAAINGVFAKLTTTALTASLASKLASLLGLEPENTVVNLALRGVFLGLNVVFNIAMWALFTAALTRSNSTTRVSVVNVSSNFFTTAVFGAIIFSEKLPPLWWLGAALLAAGNIIIGRREDGEKPGGTVGLDETRDEAEDLLSSDRNKNEPEDLLELDEDVGGSAQQRSREEQRRMKVGEDVDAPI